MLTKPWTIRASEKFGLSRGASVGLVCGAAALISIIYATGGGLYYLDTVDHFLNNFGLVLAGLVEVIFVAWVAKQLGPLSQHLDTNSYIRSGAWWKWSLMVITPVLLGVMTVYNFYNEVQTRYEDYPLSGLLVLGWGAVVLVLILGVVMSLVRDRGSSARFDASVGS